MMNNNPETVSTDYEIADRLYFEPITLEHILNVVEAEQIDFVIVQFGGQTAINVAEGLEKAGVTLLGTSFDTLDALEDRDLFYQLLDELNLPHAKGDTAHSKEEALVHAKSIGYPVLIRPSYVIGGMGMIVVQSEAHLASLLDQPDHLPYPILIDEYVTGKEIEVDLISDGKKAFIPTIVEHIEKAGVHSGDSFAILPSISISEDIKQQVHTASEQIAKKLAFKGIMNIQFVIKGDQALVLEVNPRASRTVPVVSKVMGIDMIPMATQLLAGASLEELNPATKNKGGTAVKFPVFSSHAIQDIDLKLTPEMKATGEGMCVGKNAESALKKVFAPIWKQKGSLFMQGSEQLIDEAKHAGFDVWTGSFESWLQNEDKSLHIHLGEDEEAKEQRVKALTHGVQVLTEYETVQAFLQGKNGDVSPVSLHELYKKEVTA